jgi:hypothetical protein
MVLRIIHTNTVPVPVAAGLVAVEGLLFGVAEDMGLEVGLLPERLPTGLARKVELLHEGVCNSA